MPVGVSGSQIVEIGTFSPQIAGEDQSNNRLNVVGVDAAGNSNKWAISTNDPGDGQTEPNSLGAQSFTRLWNGTTWDRGRSLSAANLAAQSGIGAAMIAPPGLWAVSSAPAVSTQGSAVKAAAGAGVRHIAYAVDYGYGATTALAGASQRLLNLRDGASGAGSVLLQLSFPLPAATILATNNDSIENRAYPGSAATAMTAEWDALQTNLFESVALSGFDVS